LVFWDHASLVWFQKISIPPPQRDIGILRGEGGLKGRNFLKECMSLNWNFQEWGVQTKKTLCRGSIGIFWKNTLSTPG